MEEFEELDELFGSFGIPDDPGYDSTKFITQDNLSQEFDESEDDEDREDTDDYENTIQSRIEEMIQDGESSMPQEPESDEDTEEAMGCSCKVNCMLQFDKNLVESHILSLREMDRNEVQMFVMGSVQHIGLDETLKGKRRKRTRFRYTFQGKHICKKTFMYINDIWSKALRNVLDHFCTNGAVPRTHGNTGRKPHNALGYNEIRFCVDWITWFADINGLPMPAAPRGRDGEAPILLPSSLTKGDLHSQYAQACEEADVRKLGVSSFKYVWKNCIPHIKIMSPKDDVCHRCEQLRHTVMDAVTEQAKLDAATSLRDHVQDAQTERNVYQTAVIQAREEMTGFVRQAGPITPLSTELKKIHVTFDYSQCVTIPHHSRQMGPMYFVTGRKINMFGVRIDSTGEQYNYLIDEDQAIGLDGTGTHGPNSVISMLHHSLHNYGFGERCLHLHADNCGGQNKNRYTLAYLCWRINRGLHENITLHMSIPGHTKCLVDGGFGRIKQLFKRSDCETLGQFADIVTKSARNNFPVLFRNEDGDQIWKWYDWKTYLAQTFLQVKGIQKYQSFRFSFADKSAVFVRERSDSQELRIPLIKRNTEVSMTTFPENMRPAGLSRARCEYLYRNVRKYVRPAYQDVTCPCFTEK